MNQLPRNSKPKCAATAPSRPRSPSSTAASTWASKKRNWARIAEPDFKALKVSTRDIPVATAKKSNGGTTVAATMFLANMAGIRVFATGGIGGVHRGAEQTFDISADLIELSRTPVAVVCAGVKSILDIGKTLEYMETHGVGVIVHGNSTNFPGFFVPKTEFKAPYHSQSLKTIASILEQGRSLAMQNGTVIACPIPSEYAANAQASRTRSKRRCSTRKRRISPRRRSLLSFQRVNELTKGASVGTNVQLLRNNAAIGAKLARILAEQSREKEVRESRVVAAPSSNQEEPKEENNAEEKPKKKWRKNRNKKPKVVCIGGTNLDFEAHTDHLKVGSLRNG
ncbi:hypothetical protein L596_015957 [Steinernema carpocapsae]|uniref:Carbohydrate kinase PfkB domain-containing protein n=1 Tax=Steinernema carpocapsae TaxID=34508 RepID=A0A4U5NGK1_STECR|nr:hypothetical protein L596_015957 [Steinernema carpocapsae]